MSWSTAKVVGRWAWIVGLLVFLTFFAVRNSDTIAEAGRRLSIPTLFAAAVLIFSAKLALVVIMRAAAARFTIPLTGWESYCIYNQSQLGKYIPGSIWQFVGRVAMLRNRGAESRTIRDSMIAEQLWVLSAAAVIAISLIATSGPATRNSLDDLSGYWTLAPWLVGVATIAGALALAVRPRLRRWMWTLLPSWTIIPVLAIVWVLFGLSLWITLGPFTDDQPPVLYVIGGYALAYLVGFMVPFAPAGLGIREAILTLMLSPYVGTDVAVLLAATNRVLYFATEPVAVAPCLLWRRQSPTQPAGAASSNTVGGRG